MTITYLKTTPKTAISSKFNIKFSGFISPTIKKEDEENDHYFEKTTGIQNWLFFAQDDHWVNKNTREYLIDRYENTRGFTAEVCSNLEDPISHSFCVTQSEQFAEITVDRIRKICD